MLRKITIAFALVALLAAVPTLAQGLVPIDQDRSSAASPSALTLQPQGDYASAHLRVYGPNGVVFDRAFAAGQAPVFVPGGDLPDGTYTYELVLAPVVDEATRAAMLEARTAGDQSRLEQLRVDAELPASPRVESGYFAILSGAMVRGGEESVAQTAAVTAGGPGPQSLTEALQVINMDLIVQGSQCLGVDCPNAVAFGFDTLRLRENNLRVKFEDTSGGAFPSTDWQLTINDSANGGANRFSVDDISGGRTPFTIEGNAPSHSLYVDDGGRIGVGTSTPVTEIHVKDGDSPTLRLEQDGSSGFTPQIWDVAGNEAGFFVRDATTGSTLPFRIRPGADSESLVIDSDNDVGIGLLAPTASLEVVRSNKSAQILVRDTGASSGNLTMLRAENNNGNVQTHFVADHGQASETEWRQNWKTNAFAINIGGGANLLNLDTAGNLTITGTYSPPSDRNMKENFEVVESADVLEALSRIPVQRWNYRHDDNKTVHIGPTAQDFYSAFGVGADDRHIATVDADGVAFAAIQALHQELLSKQTTLLELQAQNAALLERLEQVEGRLESLE